LVAERPILSEPARGAPTSVREVVLDRDVERSAIRACLAPTDEFLDHPVLSCC
jgi:hypothetical protein